MGIVFRWAKDADGVSGRLVSNNSLIQPPTQMFHTCIVIQPAIHVPFVMCYMYFIHYWYIFYFPGNENRYLFAIELYIFLITFIVLFLSASYTS